MTIDQNLLPNNPGLSDLLNYFKQEMNLSLNCHHLGTIKSFDSLRQVASATINYKKTFLRFNGLDGYDSVTVDYPIAIDCPVVCMSGGNGSLTFPIEPGDECIILFNDRDIDNWFDGSSESPNASIRTHSFADGLILVGVRSLRNVITPYDTNAVVLKKGLNTLKIYDDKVEVTLGTSQVSLTLDTAGKLEITNVTGEFVATIDKLMQDIQNATTNTMFGPQPLIMPTFASDLLVLQSFKA